MYPAEWHRIYSDMTGESARRVLPPLLDRFGARSLIEIGCGQGHWSLAASCHGISDLLAIDGPWNDRQALLIAPQAYRAAQLEQPLELGRRFDIAVCLEVAEHVAPFGANMLVRSLIDASDVVLFGAAIPLQGGHGHINEQWPSYWRRLFAVHGYQPFDLVRPAHWNDREIHYWYRQNCFVYVNHRNAKAMEAAGEPLRGEALALMDAVHPEKFEDIAAYRAIAGKRLLRALPAWLARRLRDKLAGVG